MNYKIVAFKEEEFLPSLNNFDKIKPPMKIRSTKKSNFYFKIQIEDDIIIKQPVSKFFERCVLGISHPEISYDVSYSTLLLRDVISMYPDLNISDMLSSAEGRVSFFLMVHIAHYNRLMSISSEAIPKAKFLISRKFFGLSSYPIIFQERIHGTMLWDMFERDAKGNCDFPPVLASAWRPYVSNIRSQIDPFLNSADVDFNIMNFLFNKETLQLKYVDIKPKLFVEKNNNDQNKSGIMEYFNPDRY